jgi:hypothetical protein
VATQVLVENDIARRLGLVLFLLGTLTPSLFEPLFNGRAVEAMLVGPAASFAEPAGIATCPVHDGPAEVELAHALPTPPRTAAARG